ncbi:MAG: putative inorganic carbon transporter subunit DabA, partial [Sediminibacterium sp.]
MKKNTEAGFVERPYIESFFEEDIVLSNAKEIQPYFDEVHVLHELKHYLPSQTPLRDFIHHNSLHAFQKLKFYEGIFKASKIFGYQVTLQLTEYRELYRNGRIREDVLESRIIERKGASQLAAWKEKLLSTEYDTCNTPRIGSVRSGWKKNYQIDIDSLVEPLLFRVLCSYLDQGISLWKFPAGDGSFLSAIRAMERNSFSSFFKTKRAKELLLMGAGIRPLLNILVGNELFYEQYLFDQQFSHQGWSGIVSAVEDQPNSLLDQRKISLRELIIFELLLEIDTLDHQFGQNWQPLCIDLQTKPLELFSEVQQTELTEVFMIWQDAFEWSYYDEVLAGIASAKKTKTSTNTKSFQALFCIDERECSLRRHIESTDPQCETFGTPGFFSVEFFFQPENGNFYDKLCPQPVTPKYLIKEFELKEERKHELLYTKHAHTFLIGYLITLSLGFWSGIRLFLTLFRPKMSPAISNAFAHMDKRSRLTIENRDITHRENDLQVGFTVEEMAIRVEALLRSIGLTKDFAPLIYVIAHGSSSANNPHHGAHDCGACSGRPGSINARVFAFMANHTKVRELLTTKGIVIDADTQFVGGLHDTASDEIAFYDTDRLNDKNNSTHKKNTELFENALDLNAKERSRRFGSINTKKSLKHVREEIRKRSVSLFEPRPELGHGTNTLCIVGRREMTKGLFLDRRAFLNSYDHTTDPEGKILVNVM